MTIKVNTIVKKINELKKMDIGNSDIAFGKIVDGQTEYHDQIQEARKTLNSLSRELAKAESDYVDKTTHDEVYDLFYKKFVKGNKGDLGKAIDQFKNAMKNASTEKQNAPVEKPVEKTNTELNHNNSATNQFNKFNNFNGNGFKR